MIEHHPLFPEGVNVGFAQIAAPRPHPPAGLGARRRPDQGLRHRRLRRPGRRPPPRASPTARRPWCWTAASSSIEWRESDDHVLMTGPVAVEFSGELPERLP